MTLRISSLTIILILLLAGCASKKKQAQILEASKPLWLKERPTHPSYFSGIGITSKVGSPILYEEKAKERALVDLASQINTRINTETTLRRFEDVTGVHEYLSSRIKATSTEFLEGYEYLDKWEDNDYYYVFLRLSKQEFFTRKAERKEQAIKNALLKYSQAIEQENTKAYFEAMRLYASCLDLLSGYVNEETSTLINDEKIDLVENSKIRLTRLVRNLSISASQHTIEASDRQRIKEGTITFKVQAGNNSIASNIPVRFSYTGGYLVNELGKSDKSGLVPSPLLSITDSEEKLSVKVDLIQLGRQITRNLFVRKIIEKEFVKETEVTIASSRQ